MLFTKLGRKQTKCSSELVLYPDILEAFLELRDPSDHHRHHLESNSSRLRRIHGKINISSLYYALSKVSSALRRKENVVIPTLLGKVFNFHCMHDVQG